ncbi:DUF4087 domain-containing protein [Castellaniella sp.]|uniref:DUF4087 domain-containing protein n=1 Tax=Castellaniella sp. TaxID=1955812 RepID=UPI003A91E11C
MIGNLKLTLVLIAPLLLSACGSEVRDCNDAEVKSAVVSIIDGHLHKALWYRQMSLGFSGDMKVENIAEVVRRKDDKYLECRASLAYLYNNKDRSVGIDYSLTYLEDKKDTQVLVDVDSIKTEFLKVAMSENPIKNGIEKEYDQKGRLAATTPWVNNQLEGVQERYNTNNGLVVQQTTFKGGEKAGLEVWWDAEKKEQLGELSWAQGRATGWQKTYDEYGELVQDVTFDDGKMSGFIKKFYEDGYVYENYRDGQLHGERKAIGRCHYREPYIVRELENYKNGKLDGIRKIYKGCSGVEVTEELYKDGVLVTIEDSATDDTSQTQSGINSSKLESINGEKIQNSKQASNEKSVPSGGIVQIETRCGWINNDMPSSMSLSDKDGEWAILGMAIDDPEGYEENMPIINERTVCGCLRVSVDKGKRQIIALHGGKILENKICLDDKNL